MREIVRRADLMANIEGNSGLFFAKKIFGENAEIALENEKLKIVNDDKNKQLVIDIPNIANSELEISYFEGDNMLYNEKNIYPDNIVFALKKINRKIRVS